MTKYKLVKLTIDSNVGSIYDTEEKIYLPIDDLNTEYKKYLQWVLEGNTPEEMIIGDIIE